jgi:hypothetical protein
MGGGVEEQRQDPAVPARERLAAWYPEYFALDSDSGYWMVSVEAAREIERALDRWPPPRWLRFVDITGSRIRIRSEGVRSLTQSSPEIRETWRRFNRERQEENGDPPGMGIAW